MVKDLILEWLRDNYAVTRVGNHIFVDCVVDNTWAVTLEDTWLTVREWTIQPTQPERDRVSVRYSDPKLFEKLSEALNR